MKIWCESCAGEGSVHQVDDNGELFYGSCFECDGNGYTENAEFERLKELGSAVENAFYKGAILVYDMVYGNDGKIIRYNYDEELDDLLKWVDKE